MTKKLESIDYKLDLEGKLDMVRKSIRAVTRGYQQARCIMGSKGIGKSYTVIDEVQLEIERAHEEGRGTLKSHVITGGIKDAISFYATLADYNDPNLILILDDINTVITNKDCREILRAAVTNTPERLVSYLGSNKVIRGMKNSYLNRMKFKSKILLITNIAKYKIDPGILSRMSPIEITTTTSELFNWVGKNLENLHPTNVPIEWKQEVYRFIQDEIGVNKLKHFDFRAMSDCVMWLSSCVSFSGELDHRGDKIITIDDAWKSYVHTILC